MLYLLVTNLNNRLFKHAIISISLKEILVPNTFNVLDSLYYSQLISNQINYRRKPNFKCFTIELVCKKPGFVGKGFIHVCISSSICPSVSGASFDTNRTVNPDMLEI